MNVNIRRRDGVGILFYSLPVNLHLFTSQPKSSHSSKQIPSFPPHSFFFPAEPAFSFFHLIFCILAEPNSPFPTQFFSPAENPQFPLLHSIFPIPAEPNPFSFHPIFFSSQPNTRKKKGRRLCEVCGKWRPRKIVRYYK